MKVLKGEINGIRFFHREGMSDLKTFEEVLGRGIYLKRGMTIQRGKNHGSQLVQTFSHLINNL